MEMTNIIGSIYWKLLRIWRIFNSAVYWLLRDIKYSEFVRNENVLLNQLLIVGHVIEKGITMPNRKLGFGLAQVRHLIALLNICIEKYGYEKEQIQFALDDLCEYVEIHEQVHYVLPDDIINEIEKLKQYKRFLGAKTEKVSSKSYFYECKDFMDFAYSRYSVRNYSDKDIPDSVIHDVVNLAQTAPSACNRQSVRIHVYEKNRIQDILKIQSGNRGFGHLANKLLVVTSEQTSWDGYFTKAAYLDAGIFVMNLLYALHYYHIAACTLNCYLLPNEMKRLYKISDIPNSEIACAIIAIGYPNDLFMLAKSNRISTDQILTIHR